MDDTDQPYGLALPYSCQGLDQWTLSNAYTRMTGTDFLEAPEPITSHSRNPSSRHLYTHLEAWQSLIEEDVEAFDECMDNFNHPFEPSRHQVPGSVSTSRGLVFHMSEGEMIGYRKRTKWVLPELADLAVAA